MLEKRRGVQSWPLPPAAGKFSQNPQFDMTLVSYGCFKRLFKMVFV